MTAVGWPARARAKMSSVVSASAACASAADAGVSPVSAAVARVLRVSASLFRAAAVGASVVLAVYLSTYASQFINFGPIDAARHAASTALLISAAGILVALGIAIADLRRRS